MEEQIEKEEHEKLKEYSETKDVLARMISEGVYRDCIRTCYSYKAVVFAGLESPNDADVKNYFPTLKRELEKRQEKTPHPLPTLTPEEVSLHAKTIIDEKKEKKAKRRWVIGLSVAIGVGIGGALATPGEELWSFLNG